MRSAGIVAATITLARNPDEEALILRALSGLVSLGLRVIATDGGSPASFLDAARALPNVELLINGDAPGLLGQVRTSLRHAREGPITHVLYTEPDKADFFARGLAPFLDASSGEHDASIVLASRDSESLRTYPDSQQYTEGVLNHVCGSLTGLETDYSYGPFLMSASVIELLDQLPASIGWGWRPFLFVRAHQQRLGVRRIVGHYTCPEGQRRDSERERRHRLSQLAENISGVVAALN